MTSVRAVLAASVPKRFGVKVLDVKTAFLNAHLPDSFETVYVRPPQVLAEFGLVAPGTIWRALKAIYGLRISPKAWGVERDRQLRKMSIDVDGKTYIFHQSHIDPSVWTVVRGRISPEGLGVPTHDARSPDDPDSEPLGYIVVYVDDALLTDSDQRINAIADDIKR